MRRARVRIRVRCVEPVNVRQQHQQVGAHHLGHPRRQPVIVAIANLVRRDRVILVDHRNNACIQQRIQRRPRIQPAPADFRVAKSQQRLANRDSM